MKNDTQQAPLPRANYRQYRRMKKLAQEECCNYYHGRCFALDDGEECVCVQSISYTLLCKWFCQAVLPLDRKLQAELFQQKNARKCGQCGLPIHAVHAQTLYCSKCAEIRARQNKCDWARKHRTMRRKSSL